MRSDSDTIHSIASFYGLETAKKIQSMPFFEVPECYKSSMFNGYTNSTHYTYTDEGLKYVKNGKIAIFNHKVSSEILPFSQFVVRGDPFGYVIVSRFINDRTNLGGWQLTVKLINILQLSNQVLPSNLNGCLVNIRISDIVNVGSIEELETSNMETNMDISCIASPEVNLDYVDINKTLNQNIKDNSDNSGALLSAILFLLTFFMWAESRHLVKVVGGNSKKIKKSKAKVEKKPWLRNDLPYYIYLDCNDEQSHHPNKDGDVSHTKIGHQRRSHWRTMTHERFKNHPYYNIPMRVKEAWVGATNWVSNNKTYTIHSGDSDGS